MYRKISLIEIFNALISLFVIIGSWMEYEYYYFKNFYILEDGVYTVKPDGDNNYKGMFYRSIFSIVCIITASMTILSKNLEFKLKKLQGTYFEGNDFIFFSNFFNFF